MARLKYKQLIITGSKYNTYWSFTPEARLYPPQKRNVYYRSKGQIESFFLPFPSLLFVYYSKNKRLDVYYEEEGSIYAPFLVCRDDCRTDFPNIFEGRVCMPIEHTSIDEAISTFWNTRFKMSGYKSLFRYWQEQDKTPLELAHDTAKQMRKRPLWYGPNLMAHFQQISGDNTTVSYKEVYV